MSEPTQQGTSSPADVLEGGPASVADEMVIEDNDGDSGALDFSSLVPLCVARKAFNSQQVYICLWLAPLMCFVPSLPSSRRARLVILAFWVHGGCRRRCATRAIYPSPHIPRLDLMKNAGLFVCSR